MFFKSIFVLFITATLISCGGGSSIPTNSNSPPTANAGIAQSVIEGAVVILDAGRSTDANGDPLTYKWLLLSKPPGSASLLSSANELKPNFVADLVGTYVATLVVNDGKSNSAESNVTITVNAAPPTMPLLTFTIQGRDALAGNGNLFFGSWYRSESQYSNFWDFCPKITWYCSSSISGVTPFGISGFGQTYLSVIELDFNGDYAPVIVKTQAIAATLENGNIETGILAFKAESKRLASFPTGQSGGFQMNRILHLVPSSSTGDVYVFSGVVDTLAAPSGWLSETETGVDVTANVHWYNALGRQESTTVSIYSNVYHGNFSDSVRLINSFENNPSIPKGATAIFDVTVTNRFTFKRKI